ncbi:MAG: hypothetical protein A2Y33_15145 [Spirochaetes bacterium GWF1_51_8]|nr:MAG: hypothetical protein A2Y33_15145 [Spirochaetes bacterium GWF1_51_8]
MAKTTFNEGSFDTRLRNEFRKLPEDNVSPGLKAVIMKRIKESETAIRKRNFLMNIIYRVSQATFALSLVLMAVFLPSLIESDKVSSPGEAAVVETQADKYVMNTNENHKVYSTAKPNYSYVNYVSYP